MNSRTSRRPLRIAVAAAVAALASSAHAVTMQYDFTNVGVVTGSGALSTLAGLESGTTTSTNSPVAFTQSTLNYVFGAATLPGAVSSGTWTWSNGNDSLTGTLVTTTEQLAFAGTPFNRYRSTRTVTGGTGYFAGAIGGGTSEFFSVFHGGDGDQFFYDGVEIVRLSVSVETDAPIRQTDTTAASVIVKNGVENLVTGQASNSGVFTSHGPGLLPLVSQTSQYTFEPLPVAGAPFVGTSVSTGPGGTVVDAFRSDTPIQFGYLGRMFSYGQGTFRPVSSTGAFAGTGVQGTYESFSIGTGGDAAASAYSTVVVSRPTVVPIPEPATWAALATGLGVLAGAARLRRRRCPDGRSVRVAGPVGRS